MNKNIIYIGIALIIGLIAGYFLFGDQPDNKTSEIHNHSDIAADQKWTCSMHPQIIQSEPGNCPICGMDLIPAESTAEGLAMNEIKMTENAMSLANIQTTVVGNSAMIADDGTTSLSGKIAANEENNSIQASYFDGRIERLNVNYEGQKVSRGQLLATIYAPNLVAAQQELITTASLKESQPALYKAVRDKLKNWKLSESQINAIESSGKVRNNFPVYATVSGTVAEVMSAEGDYVKQGQPILKVSDLNTVWAEFDVYENQIAQFKTGQSITIHTSANPDQEFNAKISFIDPLLDNATRTLTVRAILDNKNEVFKPGMFITGKVQVLSNYIDLNAINIPTSAVLWTGERSIVYIKTDTDRPVFEMREITLGTRNGEQYRVISGLNKGDEIVTIGTFTIDAAAQLQGKKSMMSQGKLSENVNKKLPLNELNFSLNFQKGFNNVLESYLAMKDAFVLGDVDKVAAFAKAAKIKLSSLNTTNLSIKERRQLEKSVEMLDNISYSKVIEDQRAHFVILNEYIIEIAMQMEDMTTTLYVQKCPMANDNKSAKWLSTEEEVRNPYYGKEMLTCGSIIEKLK
jgi:Cu(I)/Ag(I) efflux system membrane fusion protein